MFVRAAFSLGVCFASCLPVGGETTDISVGEKIFALKLKPLFAEKCLGCHGEDPDAIEGGFDMRTRESMLIGGDEFEKDVVRIEHGAESMLFRVAARTEADFAMPPKESESLTEEQAWWIRDWIDAGAPWPSQSRIAEIESHYSEGEVVRTSGGLAEAWTSRRYDSQDLWAYRPIQVTDVPKHIHPIDFFIDAKLQENGLDAAPLAEPLAMVRRLSFGLTGLPPSTDQVRQFRSRYKIDPAHAIVEYADELFASPHHGEHFAQHWLDVVRYADTSGFANDYARPNAWRYRDFVVRAFNDDKPYDEFIRQQIAGDEMDASDSENRIATGFLRMGPWEQTSMSVFQVTRQQWLDDVVDSVGQTLLAHPLQCCKCHDHKFDPLPTRDYYSMMAVFSTTQFAESDAAFLDSENLRSSQRSTQWTTAKIDAYQQQLNDLNQSIASNRKNEEMVKTGDNNLSAGDEASMSRLQKNISRHRWELDKANPIAYSVYTGKTIKRANVAERLREPGNHWKEGDIPEDNISNGGDVFSKGDPVVPGAISAAQTIGKMDAIEFPAGRDARRLALAGWITDKTNPLTSRVIVNRVWAWHFGRGLAANPNNFGATGGHPTHPELLDHLAQWFMDHGWSIRQLNRLIVSSDAYRRSATHPDPTRLAEIDPTQQLYAAFAARRLTAEEMRDAMLSCSGELNREVGGVPCRPDINMEVALQPRQIMGGAASVYEPDAMPGDRNRRSLYTEKIRGLRDPFFESFNQPGSDKSCELRETSTVAPQALTLLNSQEVNDRALALASRAIIESDSDKAAIRRAFQLVFGRDANDVESDACMLRWTAATLEESAVEPGSRDYPAQVTRTVMAEKTGEPYDFVEVMPAYRHYVPDLQRSEVDARTRGLSHVCLTLLNSNEFAYLD